MNRSLTGKNILITGASSGIGAATARVCAAAGATLILCARNDEALQALRYEFEQQYDAHVFTLKLDVRDRDEVYRTLIGIPALYRPVHVLVNNAGLARGLSPLYEGNVEHWEEMIDTNLKGTLYVTRAILPEMVSRREGHIVTIGSISSHRTYAGGNVYCATKHALTALSRSLKKEVEGTRIRVTSLDPGAVRTNFSNNRFEGDTTRADKVYENMEPLTAQDIADILFFCITRPSHVNISELIVLATDQSSAL